MSKLLAILNNANNWTQIINLSSPITGNYCRILSNRQALIQCSFLASSYLYKPATNENLSKPGLCLAGSYISYQVVDDDIRSLEIKLAEDINSDTREVQLILYFHE